MGCTSAKHSPVDDGNKYETAMRAAILIQKWYRRYIARLEARRMCTWNIFQSIEYSGEQDQLKLCSFFNDILQQMTPDSDGQPRILRALSSVQRPTVLDAEMIHAEDVNLMKLCNPDDFKVESKYSGPHLTFPLTSLHLESLLQSFKSKQYLHAKYLIQLLLEVRQLMKQKPNINRVYTSISNQITVCGDLHGKLDDLYMIFYKNGLPSIGNPYVFNGDFVDRGRNSIEVVVILFACLLIFPNDVYLNRGNHEDHVMNLRYGFIKEIIRKYSAHSKKIIGLFEDVFSWLPLATVIDDKVLVVHGGISDTVDLQFLDTMDRHKFVSTLQPPRNTDTGSQLTHEEVKEWKQILDILWSDPRQQDGCFANTFRGGGSYFGPDITDLILDKHKLQLLIRSHECKFEGYEFIHRRRVLTIFSASNYYEEGSNRGAYVKLTGTKLDHHIVQYMAAKGTAKRKITFTQRVSQIETSALQDLREKILGSKTELMNEFKKHDPNNIGKITLLDWCLAMETTLELVLPWRTLRSKLAKCDTDGTVIYHTTFEEMKLYHRFSENGPSLTEMLYRNREHLGSLFRLIDKDNSGCISMTEFEEALQLLIKHQDIQIDNDQIKDIAESIDLNKDGVIDFNEFLEAFRIVDQFGSEKTPRKTCSVDTVDLKAVSLSDKDMSLEDRKISKVSMLDQVIEDISTEMEC